uniref:Putative secreted protein n=1 Tax=Anopheles darlingi TaxID=43151 RepID=A0A2M4CZX8_ANODA
MGGKLPLFLFCSFFPPVDGRGKYNMFPNQNPKGWWTSWSLVVRPLQARAPRMPGTTDRECISLSGPHPTRRFLARRVNPDAKCMRTSVTQ